MLPIADACDRRRCLGAAGRGPGAVPGAGDAPTQICVPRLRGGRGSGAGARAADQGRPPTEAMVASVLVSKYAWHLPLYRQAQMLAAQGLDIKRSTLAFWVGYAAAELRPVFERLRELILTSAKIAVDETKAPVLDPGRGRVKEGYFWAVARDDRAMGRRGPSGHRLRLCTRPRGDPRPEAARQLCGRCSVRRLRRLQDDRRQGARRPDHARLLLVAPAAPVLRPRQG